MFSGGQKMVIVNGRPVAVPVSAPVSPKPTGGGLIMPSRIPSAGASLSARAIGVTETASVSPFAGLDAYQTVSRPSAVVVTTSSSNPRPNLHASSADGGSGASDAGSAGGPGGVGGGDDGRGTRRLRKQDIDASLAQIEEKLSAEWMKAHKLGKGTVRAVVGAMISARWTRKQMVDCVKSVTEYTHVRPGKAFASLPKALFSMKDAGWTPEQMLDCVKRVAESAGWGAGSTFAALVKVVSSMKDANWTPEQMVDCVKRVEGSTRWYAGSTFAALPEALSSMKDAGWSPEQMFDCVKSVAESAGWGADRAFAALPAMISVRWTPEQMIDCVKGVAKSAEGHTSEVFTALPKALSAMISANWTPEQMVDCVKGMAKSVGRNAYVVFTALPAMISANWTSEQMVDCAKCVAESTKRYTDSAFASLAEVLPAMISANWTPEQMVDCVKRVAESAKDRVDSAFVALAEVLPAMISAHWTPEQMVDCVKRVVESRRLEAARALRALPAMISAHWTPEQMVDRVKRVAESAKKRAPAFAALPAMISAGWTNKQSLEDINNIAIRAGGGASYVFNTIASVFANLTPSDAKLSMECVYKVLAGTNSHNRRRVFQLLGGKNSRIVKAAPQLRASFFEFIASIFDRNPQSGYQIAGGIFSTIEEGHLTHGEVLSEKEKIFEFISRTNGFIPSLYRVYRARGESVLVEIEALARRMHANGIGPDEIEAIARKYEKDGGLEFVLGVVKKASPTSGASFVKLEEELGLFQKMLEAGDRRMDVPVELRGMSEPFEMQQGSYELKDGAVYDPTGHVRGLLSSLRTKDTGTGDEAKRRAKEEFCSALRSYISGGRQAPDLKKVREALYRFAATHDSLHEKIDGIMDGDYTSLELLEHLFMDKDNLIGLIKEAVDGLPADVLRVSGSKKPMAADVSQFVKGLKKAWAVPKSEEERRAVIASMVRQYREEDVRGRLLSRGDLDGGLRAAIEAGTAQSSVLTAQHVATDILSEPLQKIRDEKAKFEYHGEEPIRLGVTMVKGPMYGLWGLSAGVCVATDVEMWKNPKFKLLAIVDEKLQQAVGYVHVYDVEVDGRKYMMLPGINPSVEFMGQVDAKELYPKLMQTIKVLADKGGYAGVWIPTDTNVHSNRSDIQSEIRKAKYPTRDIPEVRWNNLPSPYPVSSVFEVWKT